MIEKFVEDGVWTADDVRINLGYFDRLLLLDYGVNPLDDEDILSFYDLVQVPIDREHVHLNYFQKVLTLLEGDHQAPLSGVDVDVDEIRPEERLAAGD